MMNTIIENWYLIAGACALAVIAGLAVYRFMKTPAKEQQKKVKEWLLYAVTMAESEFGSETGALKLRCVYDRFVSKFPWLAKIISFSHFSSLVDEALDEMRKMLQTNEAAAKLAAHNKNEAEVPNI